MDISTAYKNALLAQMAYAENLNKSKLGSSLVSALINSKAGAKNVTQAQAEYFASKYVVVQQTENTETGFSATLFQEISTGEYHLATRGSDPLSPNDPDWNDANLANFQYGIAYNQVTDLLNFYLKLTHASNEAVPQFAFEEIILFQDDLPPSQPTIILDTLEMEPGITQTTYAVFNEIEPVTGLGVIDKTQQLNLTGHSLGGHLASAFTLLFPSIVNSTTTFDSAGFIGDQFDEFANVIAAGINANGVLNLQPDPVFNSSVTVNDIKAPLDPVSSPSLYNNLHLSDGLIDVFIEAEDTATDHESHELDRLVDSLVVMNLLYTRGHSRCGNLR